MSDPYGVPIARDAVRIERTLPGPIERIWAYLTESDKRATWLAEGEMELRAGGRVVHVFRNDDLTPNDDPPPAKYAAVSGEYRMEGKVVTCEPPRLLEYTWGEERGEDSVVRFELTPSGSSVRLVVTHRRLPNRDEMVGVAAGWHAHLDILLDRLEGRTPAGFWARHTALEAEYEKLIPQEGAEAGR